MIQLPSRDEMAGVMFGCAMHTSGAVLAAYPRVLRNVRGCSELIRILGIWMMCSGTALLELWKHGEVPKYVLPLYSALASAILLRRSLNRSCTLHLKGVIAVTVHLVALFTMALAVEREREEELNCLTNTAVAA